MIAKGNLHSSGTTLGRYMADQDVLGQYMSGRGGDNEKAWVHQLRGFASNDIVDAFRTAHVMAAATQCAKPFFHCQVRTPDGENLTIDQWEKVAARIEDRMGLSGQPRAIAFHVKDGHQHMHVAWSRIDEEKLKAIEMPYRWKERVLKPVCRELELEMGLQVVRNERELGQPRAPRRSEIEQAQRLGVDIKAERQYVRDAWVQSDTREAFLAALAERGMIVAHGDKRSYVVVNERGGYFDLGQRLLGVKLETVRDRLGDKFQYPNLEDARLAGHLREAVGLTMERAERGERLEGYLKPNGVTLARDEEGNIFAVKGKSRLALDTLMDKAEQRELLPVLQDPVTRALMPLLGELEPAKQVGAKMSKAQHELCIAFSLSRDGRDFGDALAQRGLGIAVVTPEDIRDRDAAKVAGDKPALHRFARTGDLVLIDRWGGVNRIDDRAWRTEDAELRTTLGAYVARGLEGVAPVREAAVQQREADWQARTEHLDRTRVEGRAEYVARRSIELCDLDSVKAMTRAYADTRTKAELFAELERKEITVARVTEEEAKKSKNQRAYLHRAPVYEAGEYVALNRYGTVFRLDGTTIYDEETRIAARLAEPDAREPRTLNQARLHVQDRWGVKLDEDLRMWEGRRDHAQVKRDVGRGISRGLSGVQYLAKGPMKAIEGLLGLASGAADFLATSLGGPGTPEQEFEAAQSRVKEAKMRPKTPYQNEIAATREHLETKDGRRHHQASVTPNVDRLSGDIQAEIRRVREAHERVKDRELDRDR